MDTSVNPLSELCYPQVLSARSNFVVGLGLLVCPPFPHCSKAWSVAGGYREAALFVLQDVWTKWLEIYKVPKHQCPIPGLFSHGFLGDHDDGTIIRDQAVSASSNTGGE